MEQEKLIHTEVVDIDDLIQDDHNFNKEPETPSGGGSNGGGNPPGELEE